MEWLGFVAAVWVFILVVSFVLRLKLLLASSLQLPTGELCQAAQIPAELRPQLNAGIEALRPLGFEFSHYEQRGEMLATIHQPRWIAVAVNADAKVHAEVGNSLTPDAGVPVRVDFVAIFRDHVLLGMRGLAGGVAKDCPILTAIDVLQPELDACWHEFLEQSEQLAHKNGWGDRRVFRGATYVTHSNQHEQRYFDFLEEQGSIKRADDHYRFRFWPAVGMIRSIGDGDKRNALHRAKVITAGAERPEYLDGPEVDAYQRHQQIQAGSQFGRWGKTLAFAASALGFAVLFGVAFSPRMVLVLIPVLLFHELGHIVAMRLCGYRDLQILFMPLGAAAIGTKANPTATQKTIVSLAGPIPGLLLAWALVAAVPGWAEQAWLSELIWMLLIINYLNLLPFMPLDGGQVVNTLLFDRFPWLQLLFQGVSLLIFAAVAWSLGDPILGILAAFLLLTIWTLFADIGLLRRLDRTVPAEGDEQISAARLFATMRDKRWIYDKKLQAAMRLVPRLLHRPTRLWEGALGLVVYAALLIAPLYVVFDRTGLAGAYSDDATYSAAAEQYDPLEHEWSVKYWNHQLSTIDDPRERYDVIVKARSALDYEGVSEEFTGLLTEAVELARTNAWTDDAAYPDLLLSLIEVQAWDEAGAETAAHWLEDLQDVTPPDDLRIAQALYSIGMASDDGITHLRDALALQQGRDEAAASNTRHGLAYAHEAAGQPAQAEQLWRDEIAASQDEYGVQSAHGLLGEFMVRQDRLPEALEVFQLARSGDMDDYYDHSLENLGWVALFDNRRKLAIRYSSQHRQALKKSRAAMSDEIPWWLSWLMGDSFDAMSAPQVSDYEFTLVRAWQRGDREKADAELAKMQQASDQFDYTLDRYYQNLTNSANDCSVYGNGVYARKARLLLEALDELMPELAETALSSNELVAECEE